MRPRFISARIAVESRSDRRLGLRDVMRIVGERDGTRRYLERALLRVSRDESRRRGEVRAQGFPPQPRTLKRIRPDPARVRVAHRPPPVVGPRFDIVRAEALARVTSVKSKS